jgi:hypothetical protein
MVPICSTAASVDPKTGTGSTICRGYMPSCVDPDDPQYQPEEIASIRQAADEDRGHTIVWVTRAKSRTQHQPYPLACVELRQSPDDNGDEQDNPDKGFRRAELQRNKHRLHFNGSRPAQRCLNRIWRQVHSRRSLSACRLCVVRYCQACPLMLIGVGRGPLPPESHPCSNQIWI